MASSGTLLRNIGEDMEYYDRALLYWRAKGDTLNAMETWCKSVLAEDIIPRLKATINEDQVLRTLGIGSGSGEVEGYILGQLHQTYPRIKNLILEPSADLLATYKRNVSENADAWKGIDNHWQEMRLQDYKEKREKEGDTTKFHFISAMESMYYFDDLGKWLDYLYGLLEDGGMLMVVLCSDTSAGTHIQREFPRLGSKMNHEFSAIDSTSARNHFDKVGIAHDDFPIPIRHDLTECFDDNPSPESEMLLDFLTHIIDFRKNSDAQLRNRFLQFLGSDKCTEKQTDGRVLSKADVDVTIVQR